MSSRRLSYAALMMAAGLTGVYAEPIPNFEVLTLVVFCSGILLGARDGALVGGLSELLFSLLNPYGAAHPLVTLAQVMGIATAGVAGGLAARSMVPDLPRALRAGVLAVVGLCLTAFFDFLTNLAAGIVYGQLRAMLIGGIPFSLVHIGTNVLLFAVVGTPLAAVFGRYRLRLSSSH
jgi:uncharacterized membrane protein